MATVRELSDPYANFMLNPEHPGGGVCRVCSTFTPPQHPCCYPCTQIPTSADAVLPISYSVHGGQLHRALSGYKRLGPPVSQRFRLQLAAVLWRFTDLHEECLASASGVNAFPLVTTVPSGSRDRDPHHPLHMIVGQVVQPLASRYERLLRRSAVPVAEHEFDAQKFEPARTLTGQPLLLVDDTWTRGANAQAAAAALKTAGSGPVGVVVIGRHVREEFGDNATRLRALSRPFDWDACALHP